MQALAEQHCKRDAELLNDIEIQSLKTGLNSRWQVSTDRKSISCEFRTRDYDQTLELVQAIAIVAAGQDHHPDICFGYNRCHVVYTTHSVGGLSLNDFICAARIDALEKADQA